MNPEVMESIVICATVVGFSVLTLILFCILVAIGYYGVVFFNRLQKNKEREAARKKMMKDEGVDVTVNSG